MKHIQRHRSLKIVLSITAWLIALSAAWYVLLCVNNPLSIFNEDPAAKVYVDGHQVSFEKGVYRSSSLKSSYTVEVRDSTGIQKREVFPLDTDSGSVAVTKKGVEWHIESVTIK